VGIPEEEWRAVEAAALSGASDGAGDDNGVPADDALLPVLRDAVNALCGTDLRRRSTLAVLRYELSKLLAGGTTAETPRGGR
jgi:hypothetical protein